MPKRLFILGSPNADDGTLSSIAMGRIVRAIAAQEADPDSVLLVTGGVGAHFNRSPWQHRALVHRELLARGARVDVAEPGDLLSANTVEDIVMIEDFVTARGIATYGVLTSEFHAPRVRFILDCLAPGRGVAITTARDPADIGPDVFDHESTALAGLTVQGGVKVDGVLHPYVGVRPNPGRSGVQ